MGAARTCRFCGGPIRLVPISGFGKGLKIGWVHVEDREAGARCRRGRALFKDRLMDRRQLMLPGMEWS